MPKLTACHGHRRDSLKSRMVKHPLKIQEEILTILISSYGFPPFIHPLLHVMYLENDYEMIISLNMHAMNL
jgi:hypothetical protein